MGLRRDGPAGCPDTGAPAGRHGNAVAAVLDLRAPTARDRQYVPVSQRAARHPCASGPEPSIESQGAKRHELEIALERLATERDLLTDLPSLRPSIGPAPTLRKVDKLGTIRLGSARYSVPNTLIATSVAVQVSEAPGVCT